MSNTDENIAPTDVEATVTPQVETTPVEKTLEPVQKTEQTPDAKQDSTPISSEAGDKDANKKPTSLLDAVKSAATKKADAASSTVEINGKSAPETNAEPKANSDEQAKDKQKTDAADKLPFHNHPRWKEMISERDVLKPKAEQYEKITSFMTSNGLTTEEVAEGFQIMALMKNNPAEAHKRISEYKAKLDAFVGEKLPEDLNKRVQEGFDSPETAKELARLKAEKQLYEQRQQYAYEQQALQARGRIHSAVANWEQQMKAKDPDWSAKQDLVTDQIKLMLLSEQPSTPEKALELVDKAHSIVKERLVRFVPQRKPLTTVASSPSSATAMPQPKSLLDAVRLGAMANH